MTQPRQIKPSSLLSQQNLRTDVRHHILYILTTQLRVATEYQLANLTAPHGTAQPRAIPALRASVSRGLIGQCQTPVAVPELTGPLLVWRPGAPVPDFNALAWRLERRWKLADIRSTTIYWATQRAVRVVGGTGGQLRQRLQVQHDLGVAAIYFHKYVHRPDELHRWVGEDLYRRDYARPGHNKIPDAVLIDSRGQVDRVIEFGGLYSADRLRKFHRYWPRRSTAYELW